MFSKRLEHASDRGADREHAACGIHALGGFLGDDEFLRVHHMVGDHFGAHRAKGADADMQGEKGVRNALKHFGGEMKSGGRRGDGAFLFGIDRLVAFAVGLVLDATHVVRQCELAVLVEIERRVPTDQAVAIFKNLGHHAADAARDDFATQLHAFARPHEAAPFEFAMAVEAEQLDATIVGKHARRNHPRVVEHQQIVGPQIFGDVAKHAMLEAAALAMHDEHPRRSAIGKRPRGNEFLGQVVIEILRAQRHRRNQ